MGSWDSGSGTCSWQRKLYIWCEEVDSKTTTGNYDLVGENTAVLMRVATNSMPNHCFAPFASFPTENIIEFEVEFNRPASKISKTAVTSLTQSNEYKCSIDWLETAQTSQLEETYNFNLIQGDLTGIVGISITGAPIHAAVSDSGYDALYPKTYSANSNPVSEVPVDGCLGSN